MNEKAIVLIGSIRADMQAIQEIYAAMDATLADADGLGTDERDWIAVAYRLHNLYNAFENVFLNVAALFENSVDDSTRWHAQLLERMRLDLLPLRPPVINHEMYDALDELRRFRHLFRHAYALELDPQRLQLVYDKAIRLRTIHGAQLDRFIRFLQVLVAE